MGFDRYAGDYDGALNKALSPSGETREYYARMRVLWLKDKLQAIDVAPVSVLDYGCGTGGSVLFLKEILRPARIVGVDVSVESIRQARQQHADPGVEFVVSEHLAGGSEFHLAFCNGVFHHIAPAQRPAALRYIYDSLIPGGLFAFWENNPWNPATRYIMRQCEFDRDAMPISLPKAKALLRNAGFEGLETSSCFYFPRWLKWLRPLEPALSSLPLGGQYVMLGRKPST
jgi:SAM-dependent methyltransferase